MGLDMSETYRQEDKDRSDWAFQNYDGSNCPHCGRVRVMLCSNGRRRCEKCNFDPDTGQFSECPGHVWR